MLIKIPKSELYALLESAFDTDDDEDYQQGQERPNSLEDIGDSDLQDVFAYTLHNYPTDGGMEDYYELVESVTPSGDNRYENFIMFSLFPALTEVTASHVKAMRFMDIANLNDHYLIKVDKSPD